MSLKFEYRDPDEKKPENDKNKTPEAENIERYKSFGHVRNLCFVQPDGHRQFLNYAYLVTGEFSPSDSAIKLTYTTHVVTITGYNLAALYDGLMRQEIRLVAAIGKRYVAEKEISTRVIEIFIKLL